MGYWERERGTIKLSKAAFTQVLRSVREAETARKEKMLQDAQTFWSSLTASQKREPDTHVYDWMERTGRIDFHGTRSEDQEAFINAVSYPSRLLRSEIEWPTNRTTIFGIDQVTISFDRDSSTVEYITGQYKRTVSRAHASSTVQAFFRALDNVTWTRGTGGTIWYHDEYSADEGFSERAARSWGRAN